MRDQFLSYTLTYCQTPVRETYSLFTIFVYSKRQLREPLKLTKQHHRQYPQ